MKRYKFELIGKLSKQISHFSHKPKSTKCVKYKQFLCKQKWANKMDKMGKQKQF